MVELKQFVEQNNMKVYSTLTSKKNRGNIA